MPLSELKNGDWCKLRDMQTKDIKVIQFDYLWHMGFQFFGQDSKIIIGGFKDEKDWKCIPMPKKYFPEYYL